MASIEVKGDSLVVHIHGWDKLPALRSTLTIPLSHVKHAVARPADARYDRMRGLRLAGGYWPGSFAAGYFWVTEGPGGALERLKEGREALVAAGHDVEAALPHVDAALAVVQQVLEDASLPAAARYLAFYDVHDPDKTIGIDVAHERLQRVVVELDEEDPDAAAARVLGAVRGSVH